MAYFCIQRRSLFPQGLSAPASYSPPVATVLCGIKLCFHMQRVLRCRYIRCYGTWRFCLYRTWWWAALPATRRPTSELRYDTGRVWFLLQTQSLFGGAHGIFSLCACCCSLGKTNTRVAIIKLFWKETERLCWCRSLHLQNHLWRSFNLDSKLDEITAQESSTMEKSMCSLARLSFHIHQNFHTAHAELMFLFPFLSIFKKNRGALFFKETVQFLGFNPCL